MQTVAQSNTTENYSLETLVRYAFHYEVQNKLQLCSNHDDPEIQTVIRYMEARIAEIAQKYK
jgi:hypothetical protein